MNPPSHPATDRHLSMPVWLYLSDGQCHKQYLLLIGSFTIHTHVFLPVRSGVYVTSFVRHCIASSELPPPFRLLRIARGQCMVLFAYSCYVSGSFDLISSTFQRDSDRRRAIGHPHAHDPTTSSAEVFAVITRVLESRSGIVGPNCHPTASYRRLKRS